MNGGRVRRSLCGLAVIAALFVGPLTGCGPEEDKPTPGLSGCLETNHGLGC